jgi:integrase
VQVFPGFESRLGPRSFRGHRNGHRLTSAANGILANHSLSAYVFHRNGTPLGNTFDKQWRRACIKAGLGRRIKDENGVLVYVGKHFHDFRRTAARNMIRAGVPQSVAMRVTGHETDAMFQRYDITDDRDKIAALDAARNLVNQQAGSTPALVTKTG